MGSAETSSSAADNGSGRSGPVILWLRRDLRLGDHPALTAALKSGRPVLPVFIWDAVEEALLGAAARWRLMKSLEALSRSIEAIGGRLILRRGEALAELRAVAAAAGASAVYWSRYYDAAFIERDKAVKAALGRDGLEARGFGGFLLREPFETQTRSGGHFKVYTPFQKALFAAYRPEDASPAPTRWPAPEVWPESLSLDDLDLSRPMNRGAAVLEHALCGMAGEAAAEQRLEQFLAEGLAGYGERRDRLDLLGASRLSAHLAFGEVSPRRIWLAAWRAADLAPGAERDVEKFLQEIVWREFAWHLAFHTPQIRTANWREGWNEFPWRSEGEAGEELDAWKRGRTGVDLIDAAMRELYVTGLMHNRARMVVASYLTKHLLIDWRLGERWFADCLIDFDPASNAMGWQWVAGSGPDAAPFFRIFNPESQAEKFDPERRYRSRWLPERHAQSDASSEPSRKAANALIDGWAFFEACPRSWRLSAEDPEPFPTLSLKAGRERALAAYRAVRRG